MSRTVWKFKVTPKTELDLPMDWEVVHVAPQGDEAFMWVLGSFGSRKHRETFVAVPTGKDVPADSDHVGSWLMDGGALVFHLFVLAGFQKPSSDVQEGK